MVKLLLNEKKKDFISIGKKPSRKCSYLSYVFEFSTILYSGLFIEK